MDLIIKPTDKCNFNCSFCSSSNISIYHKILDLSIIKDTILKYNITTIIVNGGQPLLIQPKYYYNLLQFIDNNKLNINISFTSNLLDFYNNPNKWIDLFKKSNIGVITSFQYGNKRKLKTGEIYTQNFFKKIFYKFKELIGYNLQFISVIDSDNQKYIIKTVNLAKQLNTICKLNPILNSGKATEYYPLYKMLNNYLIIFLNNLEKYQHNCQLLQKIFKNQKTCCPFNRNCYNSIITLNPDGKLHTCGAFDDISYNNNNLYDLSLYQKNKIQIDNFTITSKCLSCQFFNICNGCYRQIFEIKKQNSTEFCKNIKPILLKLKSIILK